MNLSKNAGWLIVVVILTLFVLSLSFPEIFNSTYREKLKQAKERIEQLEKEREQILYQRDSLYGIVDHLEDLMIDSDRAIDSLNKQLEKISQSHHEQVDNIYSLTDDELQQYFTDRYPGGTPH